MEDWRTRSTLGFFEAEIVNGTIVPEVPHPEVLHIVTGRAYVTLRSRWAELSEEDKDKVRRFEAIATGIGSQRRGAKREEHETEDEEPEAATKQGSLFG